jgi:hypothetical protein
MIEATLDRAAPRRLASRTTLARVGLVIAAAAQAEIGIWGLAAPHSLYTTYPGAGHHWIAALGPYDEHLVRDFASMELGFAVLLVCAAIWFERRLVLVAGAACMAATLPHFVYHLFNTDALPAADNVASLAGFALEIGLVAAAMVCVLGQAAGATASQAKGAA